MDVHVRRLREQIEEQPDSPRYLTTVRGFGYRFEEPRIDRPDFPEVHHGGVLGLLLLALVTVDYFATEVARDSYIQNLTGQLAGKARILALTVGEPGSMQVERIRTLAKAAGGRVTVVRSDGTVVLDSEANAAEMENHRTPPVRNCWPRFAARWVPDSVSAPLWASPFFM